MNGICKEMNGEKCAMEYCDYWNEEEQACSTALESHARVKILNLLLEKVEKLIYDAKDKEELTKIIKDLNIVDPGSKLMQ